MRNLHNLGIDYRITNSGMIISHTIPAPGQPMPVNTPIWITMDATTRLEGAMVHVPDVTGLSPDAAYMIIREAELTPLIFKAEPRPATDEDFVIAETVYRQLPAAGTVVERGLQVKLRIRT